MSVNTSERVEQVANDVPVKTTQDDFISYTPSFDGVFSLDVYFRPMGIEEGQSDTGTVTFSFVYTDAVGPRTFTSGPGYRHDGTTLTQGVYSSIVSSTTSDIWAIRYFFQSLAGQTITFSAVNGLSDDTMAITAVLKSY